MLAALLALAACGEADPPALEVGPVAYTAEEVWALLPAQRERLALLTALGVATAERRIEEVAAPLVRDSIDALVFERFVLEQSARAAGVDSATLARIYVAVPEYRLTVRHILASAERWRDADVRAAALERARGAHRRLLAGEPFETVAAELSEEPGAATRGGQLEPGRRGAWVDEFWNAAVTLDVGAISDPIETEYGYHVIELLARDTVPLDSVRWEVLARLPSVRSRLTETRTALERRLESEGRESVLGSARRLEPDAATRAAIERTMMERLTDLAAGFGFREGANTAEIRSAALAAQGDARQSIRIATEQVTSLADALRAAVPIRSDTASIPD